MTASDALRWGQDRVWWESFAAELEADFWDVAVVPCVVVDEYNVELVVGHVRVRVWAQMFLDRLTVDMHVDGMNETLPLAALQWVDPGSGLHPTFHRPLPEAAASRLRTLHGNRIVDLSTAVGRLCEAASNTLAAPLFSGDDQ